jgi:hypothetical protein
VTLTATAVLSGQAYFTRPPADLYQPFSNDVVAMSQMASDPGSAVIADDYSSTDVRFLDYDSLPAIIEPGTVISNPRQYKRILALSREDLAMAVGPELAAGIVAVAWNPDGDGVVWEVIP